MLQQSNTLDFIVRYCGPLFIHTVLREAVSAGQSTVGQTTGQLPVRSAAESHVIEKERSSTEMQRKQAVGRKRCDWQLSCVSGRSHFGRSVTGVYPRTALKPRAPVTSAGRTAALQHGERAAFMKNTNFNTQMFKFTFGKIIPEA